MFHPWRNQRERAWAITHRDYGIRKLLAVSGLVDTFYSIEFFSPFKPLSFLTTTITITASRETRLANQLEIVFQICVPEPRKIACRVSRDEIGLMFVPPFPLRLFIG